MIAPDKKFVRRLRRRVRITVRASRTLRRQRRAGASVWRRNFSLPQLRGAIPILVFFLAATSDIPHDVLLRFGLLWSLGLTLIRIQQINSALSSPPQLWMFFQLPVDPEAILQHQQTLLLRSSAWLLADWLGLGGGLAVHFGTIGAWLLIPVLAFAQWAVAVAVALWVGRQWPRLPYGSGISAFGIVFFVCARFYANPGAQQAFIGPFFFALENITPAGWLVRAAAAVQTGNPLGWLVIVAVGASAAGTIPASWAARRRDFNLDKIFGYEESAAPAAGLNVAAAPEVSSPLPEPRPAPVVSAADLVEVRKKIEAQLAQPPGLALFSRGWLERQITRALSARQRTLVDYFRPRSAWRWGRGWAIALGLLCAARAGQLAGLDPFWVIAADSVALLFFALPVFGGTWQGFNAIAIFQQPIGMHSFLPIGFGETARLILSINAIRTVAALPLVILAVRYSDAGQTLDWMEALGWSLKIGITVLAIQPIWVLFSFSRTTNDATARWWFTLLIMLGVGGALLAVVFCVMGFAAPDLWPLLPAAALYTHGLLLGYGYAWSRGVFDLVGRTTNRSV